MARRTIRFLLGRERREIEALDPHETVLEYLRLRERRCGTKEGCAEGDCGACTVVLGELDGAGLRYRAVNACIQFVPALDGKQLLTVEDLKSPEGGLHPVQQALVENHGSQCGFCTPGFVMALYALYRRGGVPDRAAIDEALAGNLCRCTGYGPIIVAARRMGAIVGPDPIAAHEAETIRALRALADGAPIELEGGGRRYYAPTRVDDLADLLLREPGARLFCGATDVGLWVTKQHRAFETLVYLGQVAELKRLDLGAETIEIGAAVTYAEALAPLERDYPDFGLVLRRLGSEAIRNVGTIGGNIANGSPIGDTPPLLIALGASLILRRGAARRQLPLEDYFLAYGEQDRKEGEFIEAVRVPRPDGRHQFRAYKISKRFDQDISAVCGAFNLGMENGALADVRICFGGLAGTPLRARRTERFLLGRPWTEPTVRAAMAEMAADYSPISDHRASGGYRLRVAQNLLYKAYLETGGAGGETRLASPCRAAG